MNFEDEDYRRIYVRRTVTTKRLGWEGRAVRNEMLTEFDRAGVWEFTGDAAQDIADLVDLPVEVVRVGLARLLATKTWVMIDGRIVWPNFVPAQTCPRSDRIRQQELRERRRDEALSKTAKLPSGVTDCHAPSRESRNVTPILADPNLPPERDPERAPEVPGLERVGGVARTHSMPSKDPPREYLEEATMRAISAEQARSTWEHYWGAGLPVTGVERLHDWLLKRAKDHSVQIAKAPRAGPRSAPTTLEPTGKHRAFAKRHGLDLGEFTRRLDEERVVEQVGPVRALEILGTWMSQAVAEKRKEASA